MATVETPGRAVQLNGGDAGSQIPVENPATGETIGHVPDMDGAAVKHMGEIARAAQPAWAGLGLEARAKVFYRGRKWLVDHPERRPRAHREGAGKTHEDA